MSNEFFKFSKFNLVSYRKIVKNRTFEKLFILRRKIKYCFVY